MLSQAFLILATFTSPEQIGTNPKSMLWLLPLAAAIAVGYKATKLSTITTGNFIKEVLLLFGSMIAFMVITAVVLWIFTWAVTE